MHKMEPLGLGAFPDGEWDCFHRTFVTERHYLPQFLDHSSVLLGEEDGNTGIQPMFFPTPESEQNESLFYSFDAHNSNLHYISQESSHSSSSSGGFTVFMANPGQTNSHFGNPDYVLPNDTCTSMDCYMIDLTVTDIVMEENASLNEDERSDYGSEKSDHSQVEPVAFPPKHLQLKRKLDLPELEVPEEDKIYLHSSGNDQKKKPRVSKDVQRCMKNARSKKNQKHNRSENEAEETNAGSDGQGSSSYTSDDDNANQENSTSASKSPAALNLNGNTRTSKASATDPQSLYARKRRERINDRLRILQNLVPSGAKVDVSTMLEEAVHYVKFLQLQIKLLSSDDLWMYAPIA